MALGKCALFSLTWLALVSHSMASTCTMSVPTPANTPMSDNAAIGTLISSFVITGDVDISAIAQPVPGTNNENAFLVLYDTDAANNQIVNMRLFVGPEFGNLVDVRDVAATFKPDLTFTCPGTSGHTFNIPDQYTITVTDTNNQAPTFVDVPSFIQFDRALYTGTGKPVYTFHVDDADSTVANTKVSITHNAPTEILVAKTSEPTQDNSQTTFTVTLNSPIVQNQVNLTLTATNDAEPKHSTSRTIHFFFPSSAIQQAGTFFMVAILSVVSAFAGKY